MSKRKKTGVEDGDDDEGISEPGGIELAHIYKREKERTSKGEKQVMG